MRRGRTRSYHSDEEFYDDEDDAGYMRPPQRRSHRPRRRSVWPALLLGCGLGIFFAVLAATVVVFITIRSIQDVGMGNSAPGGLGGVNGLGPSKTFSDEQSQTFPPTSLSQLLVCDQIGNVTITTDTTATITVTTKKIVHTADQSSANREFKRIDVAIQTLSAPAGKLSCASSAATTASTTPSTTDQVSATGNGSALIVNVNLPDYNGVLRGTNDAVDVTITLPSSVMASAGPSFLLTVNAPLGNITVDGVSGDLQIKGSSGNIGVSHAVLAVGSHIETGEGNVTFSGALAVPSGASATGGSTTSYLLQSEQGNIDVTLPANTNVTLDANTNVGKINGDDFALTAQNQDGSMSYHGPLNPANSGTPVGVLILDVSTGNVTLHKEVVQ
jgi:hypothetical protein